MHQKRTYRHLVHSDVQRLQPDIHARLHVADEGRRQAIGECRRYEECDLAVDVLAHQSDQIAGAVHRDGRVLRKEVAGMECLAALWVDERVVVRGIGLGVDLAGGGREPVSDGADELRQTPYSIAVLNEFALASAPVTASRTPAALRATKTPTMA